MADVSGNGNYGQLQNGATLGDGVQGKALLLNGKGAYMEVKDSRDLHFGQDQNFAISFWFKLAGGDPGIVMMKAALDPMAAKRYSPGMTQMFRVALDKGGGEFGADFPVPSVRFECRTPIYIYGIGANSTMNLADGTWHHVAVVRDASEEVSMVYVDGEYAGSGSGWMCADFDCPDPLLFGVSAFRADGMAGRIVPADYSFGGLIDEVTFYGGILTPHQAEKLYAGADPEGE